MSMGILVRVILATALPAIWAGRRWPERGWRRFAAAFLTALAAHAWMFWAWVMEIESSSLEYVTRHGHRCGNGVVAVLILYPFFALFAAVVCVVLARIVAAIVCLLRDRKGPGGRPDWPRCRVVERSAPVLSR